MSAIVWEPSPDAMPRVVDVALEVPDSRCVLRLRHRRRVPRADGHLVLVRPDLDVRLPGPPAAGPAVVEQLRGAKRLAVVARELDALDGTSAAGDRVAAHAHRAALELPVERAADRGV